LSAPHHTARPMLDMPARAVA
jgi:hypothetical protein